jgi:hypothetical protein
LFFECCVVSSTWDIVSEMLGFRVGVDFESIAKLWLMDKKCKFINIFTVVILWCLWKTRNYMCFLAGDEKDLWHVCELVTKLEFVVPRTDSPRDLGERVGRKKRQAVGDHLEE